jgi:hypothetical protein
MLANVTTEAQQRLSTAPIAFSAKLRCDSNQASAGRSRWDRKVAHNDHRGEFEQLNAPEQFNDTELNAYF